MILKTEVNNKQDTQVLTVAYLGPEATFSHQAAVSLFNQSASLRAAESIEDVFELVDKDICQEGVVPIENSYEGAIHITQDLFYQHDLIISAELLLRIHHHLLSGVERLEDIKGLFSHPMPVAQCRRWIKKNLHGVPIINEASTSLAVKKTVSELDKAAIGSRLAGLTHGLNILKENIEDHPDNMTRFLVIGKNRSEPTGKDKTSLLFLLKHKPGSLYKALGALADKNVNMTSIESRPVKTKTWEYMFFVDVEGHDQDDHMIRALRDMEKYCVFMKRLGSYPINNKPWD